MKSIFRMLTFLIVAIMVLVVIGVFWTDGPIVKIYSGFAEYTNYIIWLLVILGAVALFFDFKNINKGALVVYVISVLSIFIYFLLNADAFGDDLIVNGDTVIELIKSGPLSIIALFILVPVLVILSVSLGEFSSILIILVALLLFFSIACFVLICTTRTTNSISKALRVTCMIFISLLIGINIILFIHTNLKLTMLSNNSFELVIKVYLCSVLLMFFSGIGFFTANYGFDSVIEDVSMSAADTIIEKNIKELYTHPAINTFNEQDQRALEVAQEPSSGLLYNPAPNQQVDNIINAPIDNRVMPVIEDNPLPVATEQILKNGVINRQDQQTIETNQENPPSLPLSDLVLNQQVEGIIDSNNTQTTPQVEDNPFPVASEEVLKGETVSGQVSNQ